MIILGAGASIDFGLPVLAKIFEDASVKQYLEENRWLHRILSDIFWQPRRLKLESSHQGLNIEEMLTYLKDIETTHGNSLLLKELDRQDIANIRRGLYVVIERAVFEGKSSRGMHLNRLIDVCGKKFEHVTWASFNWDCIFESSFWYLQGPLGAGRRVNPSLAVKIANWRQGTAQHLLLKLHGAVNWWIVNGVLTYLPWTDGGPLKQKWDDYERNATKDFPVLLEPSFYKYQDQCYKLLETQWDVFSERLADADCVLIIGYSLPDSDTYARSRILTAYQANAKCNWLLVDPSKNVFKRYRKLVGSRRIRIKYSSKKLRDFNRYAETDLSRVQLT